MSQPTKSDYEKIRTALGQVEVVVEVNRREIEIMREEFKENRNLKQELAVLKQRCDDQQKHLDRWDARVWGLVVVLVGALLSLAAGLIVALTRKSP